MSTSQEHALPSMTTPVPVFTPTHHATATHAHPVADDVESRSSKKDVPSSSPSNLSLEELIQQMFERFVNSFLERDLKPYFDFLDTKTFLRRLVRTVVPQENDLLSKPDLYGPSVLAFALSSCMHFAFKRADPAPLDRYLSASLLICFASLFIGALLLDLAWQHSSAMARQNAAKYGLDCALCVVGYHFFGMVIIVLLDGRIPRVVFYPLALGLEGMTAVSFGATAHRGSKSQSQVLGVACAVIHLIWAYNMRSMASSVMI